MPEFQSINTPPGQSNYTRYMAPALAGMMSGIGSAIMIPALNNYATYDTVTITPPETVDNSATYTVTIAAIGGGQKNLSESFTTDGSATTAELGTGLYNAMITDPEFYSAVNIALNTSTSVITLTARSVGTVLTVTSNSSVTTNDLTIAKTVTGAANTIIPFGRFVGRQAAYYRDPLEGFGTMSLVDHASNYSEFGITMLSQATEQVGLFQNAQDGYAFGKTMEILRNSGTYRGIWIETVESDLVFGDTARIQITAGNQGKLTKSTSSTVNVSSNVTILSSTQQAFGKNITLCKVDF